MTTYVQDQDGQPVSEDCALWCVTGDPAPGCPGDACSCSCHRDGARAREVDDRHPDKLGVIAAELEHEARPEVQELTFERFGRSRRAQ